MKKKIIIISLLVLAASVAFAADAAKKTSDAKMASASKPAELKAWAEEVRGSASYGVVEGEKAVWKKLTKGHEFKPQQFIRTGLRDSYVLVKLSNGCYTEVKASTKIGISTLYKEGATVHHNIALKYGSIKAKVEASKGENDFSVSTPRGTLSARGSLVGLAFAGDRGLGARGYSGTWHAVSTQTGLHQNIQNGQSYNNTNALASVIASQHRDVRLGDPLGGLSNSERQNLIDNGGGRGVFNFDGGTNNGSGTFTESAPQQLTTYWSGGGTWYEVVDTPGHPGDWNYIYGSGDWTRGEKSGRWEGNGYVYVGDDNDDNAGNTWNDTIQDASGVYKVIDPATSKITENGTWQGSAPGSGTYTDGPASVPGGESTYGTWQGSGTFEGTSQVITGGEKTVTGGGMETGGGQSLTNGG